jgi:uncharacterized protein (TIGR01777 family)
MKIILTGGTGFIGKRLIEKLATDRHEIVLLSRNPSAAQNTINPALQVRQWDGKSVGAWSADVDGADAVINLAGEPVAAKRWTGKQKAKILESRVLATRAIVEAIKQARKKPAVLINGSAVGYYGAVENGEVTESHKQGTSFLADVVGQWEREALAAESVGVRVAMLRIGVVLGEGGGALEKMALQFKMFAGGTIGSGSQWFPWVHRDDVVKMILFALTTPTVSGPINAAAPDSVTMRQFCNALGAAMHRPSWAPVPGFVLRLALGEMSEMLLTGQRVVPARLLALGYSFQFPKLDGALTDIFS